jgi:hypothetical protein
MQLISTKKYFLNTIFRATIYYGDYRPQITIFTDFIK